VRSIADAHDIGRVQTVCMTATDCAQMALAHHLSLYANDPWIKADEKSSFPVLC